MSYPTTTPATWFVTGTSRGLGLELVKQLLARGDNVAATTRSTERLNAALEGIDASRLLPLSPDLRDPDAVQGAVQSTVRQFGTLDVVVNNAGYGLLAAVEETTDTEARDMFDVQFFGAWNVLRAAMPILREKRSGHIINVSSVLGLTALPGWGSYCASKFALEGLSESLAGEAAEFGIKVSVVEPGYFRTDFLSGNSLALPSAPTEGYESIREMTETHRAMPGSQPGNPTKAAEAIIVTAVSGDGPVHQLLGSDSYAFANAKVEALKSDIEAGRELAHTTDFAQS